MKVKKSRKIKSLTDHEKLINLIAVQSSLLWCQSFSAHSSRLDLSLRELLTISSASVGNGDLRTYRLIVSGDDLNGNEYDPELIIYFIEP